MSARLLRAARVVVPATIAVALALAALPSHAGVVVRVWLLVVVGLAAATGLGALRRSYPTEPGPFDHRSPRGDAPLQRFSSLVRVEREVTLAATSAHDVHFRLRPTVRTTAAELLSARRGVALDRQPERSRELLGDETWELVRADRPAPDAPRGPGLDRAALDTVVTSLEAL